MGEPTTQYCSFCGKSQHVVGCLVLGPAAAICDECSDACAKLIAEKLVALHLRDAAFETLGIERVEDRAA